MEQEKITIHRVNAEMQRDRLSYELDSVKQLSPVKNHWSKDDED